MKLKPLFKYGVVLGLFIFGLSTIARSETRGITSNGASKVYTIDTASTNLPATYGNAGNAYATGLNGASHVCVLNGSSTKLYGAVSTVTNCTGTSFDNFVFPASGSACYDFVKTNTKFCLRSSSGTISSGVIDPVIW